MDHLTSAMNLPIALVTLINLGKTVLLLALNIRMSHHMFSCIMRWYKQWYLALCGKTAVKDSSLLMDFSANVSNKYKPASKNLFELKSVHIQKRFQENHSV